MKRFMYAIYVSVFVLFLAISPVKTVFAEGTTTIYLSTNTPSVGDTVTMTVKGSATSTITVKYNTSVLTLNSCSAPGYTTNGNAIIFKGTDAKIGFKAANTGKSDLIVSSDSLTGASTSVNVGGESAQEESAETEETEAAEETPAAPTPAAGEGDYTVDGVPMVVSERFEASEMPAGFERQVLEIHGGTYSEPVNPAMKLLYLKPAADTSGSGVFYVFDEATDSVSKMHLLGDKASSYVIVLPSAEVLHENMIESNLDVNGETFPAYQFDGIANDFYYIYGMSNAGAYGWFEYDATGGTVQRVNEDVLSRVSITEGTDLNDPDKSKEKESENMFQHLLARLGNVRLIMAVLIFALVVLLIVIIDILVFKRRDDDVPLFDEEDDVYVRYKKEDDRGDIVLVDKDGLSDVEELDPSEDSTSDVGEKEEHDEEDDDDIDDEEEKPDRKTKKRLKAEEKRRKKEAKRKKKEDIFEEDEPEEEEEPVEDDEEEEEPLPKPKKRKIFVRRSKQDDIWSDPSESDKKSIFDDEDEYEKFFRKVRQKNGNNEDDDDKVDVIDLNDL